MPDVFLSYARADDHPDYDDPDKHFMRRLYNALTVAGFDVWWDRVNLPARSLEFTKEIESAVKACERLILVVGPGAIASEYVEGEWRYALEHCKPIMPILREGDYGLIPDELAPINAIDCRPARDEDAALSDIIARLREDAPVGPTINVSALPEGHLTREEPFNEAQDALCSDAIDPTVISAPPSAVAVYGLGGIGKSTLAAALGLDCRVRRHYPDGVLWVTVGQNPIIPALQAQIGTHYGDPRDNYQDEQSGAFSLSRVLSDKAALIVLDDVWNHQDVRHFPVNGTRCRLLLTTRSGKLADQVQGADIRLDILTPAEGAQLIKNLAGGDDPLYQQISERLGGHTLAVTLAARQIEAGYAEDAADLLRLLEKRATGPEPFRDLVLDDADKDLNLARSLSLSYDALPDDDLRRRFRQVGILALESTFDRAMLAAIWGDDDEDDARRPIAVLAGAGLLDAEGDGYYSQHGLLHAYARALLREHGELDATFDRYADYVVAQAAQFDELPLEDWGQLDPLLPHVDHTGEALVDRYAGNPDLTRRMSDFAGNIINYVFRRPQALPTAEGTRLRGLNWLEAGLAAARAQSDQRRESLLLNEIALAWRALGEQDKALDYYQQALPLRRAVGDRGGEAATLNNIGGVWRDLGEQDKALDYFQQALTLDRAVGDRGGEATTLNNIGEVWRALGEPHKALDYYQQALSLYRAVGDRGGEAGTLNNIGLVWDNLGEKDKALDYYDQALPLLRSVGDRGGEATTLNNIGAVWHALGENDKALDYYQQALPLRQAVGDRGGEATTCFNIGVVYRNLGDLDTAIGYVARCVELEEQISHPDLESDRRMLEQLKRERDGEGPSE